MSRSPTRSCVLLRLGAFCLLVAGLPSTGYSQFAATLPTARELEPYRLEMLWWGQAVIDPAQDRVLHLTIDEDNVYVQTSAGIVTAFHGQSGERLWSVLLGAPGRVSLPLASNEREALVAIGLQLYGLNKFTGELLWQIELPHHPSTAPEVDSDHVYLGMVDGSVYCYSLEKIRQLWQSNRLPRWSNTASLWRHKAPREITGTPISNGRTVTFASLDGTVYCVSALDHKLIFQFETDAPIDTPLGRGADALYVAAQDTRLYCLNANNGARRWSFTAGIPIRQQPWVIGGNVYVAPHQDGLYCLSTTSGITRWHQPQAMQFLASNNSYVCAADSIGDVLLLSHEDGSIVGRLRLRGLSQRIPNERTDRLYLGTPDGLVVCLRERGQEFPLYHKFPERRPILPEMTPDDVTADGSAAGRARSR